MASPIDEVHLPPDIEQGSAVGPRFQTSIVPLSSGNEARNADWQEELIEADISYGMMSDENPLDLEDSYKRIVRFFRARWGQHRGFLFQDPSDFEARDEPLYPIGGQPNRLQLACTYDTYRRRITRPRAPSLVLYSGPVVIPKAGVPGVCPSWDLDTLGQLVFSAPPPLTLRADFDFDVPVRFSSDLMQVSIETIRAGQIPSIKIVQVRE